MGRQAPRRERRDRGAQQRLHRGRGTHCRPRVRARLPRADGGVFRDAPARHLVRPDDRRRYRGSLAKEAKTPQRKGRIPEGRRGSPRGSLREGSRQGPDEGERPAHRLRRRPVADRRRPAGGHPRRDPGRGSGARQDVPRVPGDPGREPARARRALSIRRLRAQGRRRRQRRHPVLRRPPRGTRRGRSAAPPGEGGDRVRARSVPRPTARTRTTASVSSSASG